jgi:hypothetical protein
LHKVGVLHLRMTRKAVDILCRLVDILS